MRTSTAAGLVGAAMLSTLVFPFVGAALRRRRRTRARRIICPLGRVAQWESARFTRERSLVRNQPCPLDLRAALICTGCCGGCEAELRFSDH